MTVYARSDLVYTSVSPDHGGCGVSHARPVIEGAPVKLWALSCPNGCEDFLRNDDLWSSTPQSLPETPDEVVRREDIEKRGAIEQQESTAYALTELAKLGDLPAAIAALMHHMAGQQPQLPPAMDKLCQNGHRNGASSTFCGECGVPLDAGVSSNRGKALSSSETSSDGNRGDSDSTDPEVPEVETDGLDDLTFTQLKAIARQRGVSIATSKQRQLDALKAESE